MIHKIISVLILPLLLTAVIELRAQVNPLGIRAGFNLSTLAGNVDVTFIPGYHLGFLVEKELGTHFIFQPNLLFSTHGAKEKGGDKTKYLYQYINLQLNFKNALSQNLSLVYGPQFNTLFNATLKNEGEKNEVITSNLRTIDFALSVGLNLKVVQNLSLVAAYNLGLVNNYFPLSEDSPHQNRSFQFSIICLFKKNH